MHLKTVLGLLLIICTSQHVLAGRDKGKLTRLILFLYEASERPYEYGIREIENEGDFRRVIIDKPHVLAEKWKQHNPQRNLKGGYESLSRAMRYQVKEKSHLLKKNTHERMVFWLNTEEIKKRLRAGQHPDLSMNGKSYRIIFQNTTPEANEESERDQTDKCPDLLYNSDPWIKPVSETNMTISITLPDTPSNSPEMVRVPEQQKLPNDEFPFEVF